MRVAVICIALFLTSPAFGEDQKDPREPTNPQALEHYRAGEAAFNRQDYAEASRRLSAAYEIEPMAKLVWSWAQAERMAGNCVSAVGLYKKYARESKSPKAAENANAAISLCERGRKQEVTERPPDERPTPSPWYQNKLGGALTAGGVVGVTVGITFLALSSGSESASKQEMFLDDYEAKLAEATFRLRFGGASLGLGIGLIAAGVTVYVLHDRNQRALTAGTDGRVVFVGARF